MAHSSSRATRHAATDSTGAGAVAEKRIADARVKEPVVAGDGFDGPGHHAAVDIHSERAPCGGRLLAPMRIGDARDLVERFLLRVDAPLP